MCDCERDEIRYACVFNEDEILLKKWVSVCVYDRYKLLCMCLWDIWYIIKQMSVCCNTFIHVMCT